MVSLGTPMLLMGAEMRRTQLGNNNAYCQDTELSWMDWALLDRHADVYRFAKLLIHARLNRYSAANACELTLNEMLRRTAVEWHGTKLHQPDWSRHSHSIALTGHSVGGLFAVHYIFNSYWEPLTFEIPALDSGTWLPWGRWIDTGLDSPDDICIPQQAPMVTSTYVVHPRSAVVLIAAGKKAAGA
jgi:glycogen operon protein